ncbi:hypothetical protein ACN4EK_27930 [Pantanalinema rosaneae CENA516]|uniref:hypothetical protein n=1 Tax=Pantanalinema rosaneae TaxID=1620701 RepID=UPI003D6E0C23
MRTYLNTYFKVLITLILAIGLLNYVVDPLWYHSGNRLTAINPPWNERVAKTNLYLQQPEAYNCLIFGTSRATILHTEWFQNHHCFNYAFSGGKIEEIISYADYIKQKGANPAIVYVEVEPFKLNEASDDSYLTAREIQPTPLYETYFFSMNTLSLSLRTVLDMYEHSRLYNQHFKVTLSEDIPDYEPELIAPEPPGQPPDRDACKLERVKSYQALKQKFPQAEFVGFVAPISAWRVFNTMYAEGLLNCQLAGTHQIASLFNRFYDFAIPSAMTTRTDNTYDGNHYYPQVFQDMAQTLEGQPPTFGVDVKQYPLATYQSLYATRLQQFLQQIGKSDRWQG